MRANMAGELRHKVAVYAGESYTDELKNKRYRYILKKYVWAAILPMIGERVRAVKNDKKGGMVYTTLTHKFIIRYNSLVVSNDMYFVYKGQRYDVDYAVPYFKDTQYQEVYAQLRSEGIDNLREE